MLGTLMVLSFMAGAFGDCGWPNGTDTGLHWWADPNPFMDVYSATSEDTSGNLVFTIRKQPIFMVLKEWLKTKHFFAFLP